MKKIFLGLVIALGLTACSSEWLDKDLTGDTLTQEEYEEMNGTAEGTVRGLYSLMYGASGEHHYFGQKSIDIATDLMSGDMAMTADAYGWFVDAEQGLCAQSGSGRNEYIWSYYYAIIMNANSAIRTFVAKDQAGNLTYQDMNAYAQSLTMRAYSYFNLAQLYSPSVDNTNVPDLFEGKTGLEYMCVPIYTENSYNDSTGLTEEQGLSAVKDVYAQAVADAKSALGLFKSAQDTAAEHNMDISRPSKLYVNEDIANAFIAYSYLQTQEYDSAYTYAKKVIDAGHFHIMPYDKVLTTGFTNVEDPSWMWGQDVTIENTGALASFWGHVDVHTYSYAYAGATKAMDDVLYKEIPATDIRKKWFDESKKCIPDYKFYDQRRGVTADQIDRRWLNDNVFMRIEEMYLVAAEAAYRAGNMGDAKDMLKELVDERDTNADAIDSYDATQLRKAIYFNWRVELWGEGRGLMTFKRFSDKKNRGKNHFAQSGNEMIGSKENYVFQVPFSETVSNNSIVTKKPTE